MGRKRIEIDKDSLTRMYWIENLSPYKIAEKLKCSFSTVTNRMKEHKIDFKSHSAARIQYRGNDFNNNQDLKSYMIGFRIGDLNCYKKTPNSEVIIARCHSTELTQIKLLEKLFRDFGHINISVRDEHQTINIHLNRTFDFLMPKNPQLDEIEAIPFITGYTEAEGCFQLNQGRARFKMDSYDIDVLRYISDSLTKLNIQHKFCCVAKKGQERSYGKKFNNDLWRITINRMDDLRTFILTIKPYMRHEKHIQRSKICLENIKERKNRKTIEH